MVFYNRALTADEVNTLMNGDVDTSDSSLLIYYNFDDGDLDGTNEILDSSGNNNNAQLFGAATYEVDEMVDEPTPAEPIVLTMRTDSCPDDEFMVGFEC